MEISRLNGDFIKINQISAGKTESAKPEVPFSNVLQKYMDNVDTTVKQASNMSVMAAAGTVDNLHDVAIASQKAKIALELTVTVRDKAVEAYQEMMRMQM